MTKMTRQEVINTLIDWAFDSDIQSSDESFEEILREGFKGYENMTNKELEELYNNGLEEDEIVEII